MKFIRRLSSSIHESLFKWRNTDGIFGVQDFRKAEDLMPIARRTRQYCHDLYKNCLQARSMPELLSIMDEISNNLCSIMDLAVCIRHVHPHLHFKRAAYKCLQFMQPQLQLMNTSKELFEKFCGLCDYDDRSDPELKHMYKAFMKDFELAGVTIGKTDEIADLVQRAEYLARMVESAEDDSLLSAVSNMAEQRHRLANALGYESFVDMSLRDSWFKNKSQLWNFLKAKHEPNGICDVNIHRHEIPQYTLQQLIEGFVKLVNDKLDLRVIMKPCHFTWAFGLFALDVYCKEGVDLLGSIYVDPFSRENKASQSTHYTIRGSKSHPTNNSLYSITELPQRSISLVSAAVDKDQPIDYFKAQTIIHEFGHALHAVLSKTKYQSFSGTRCALEVAEFPSTFMESIFEMDRIQKDYFGVCDSSEFFEKLKMKRFIHQEEVRTLALIDLALHSSTPQDQQWANTAIRLVYKGEIKIIQLRHLAAYGSSFYAYSLADRLCQSMINMSLEESNHDPWTCYRKLLNLGGLLDVESIIHNIPGQYKL